MFSYDNDPVLATLEALRGQQVHFIPKSGNAGDGVISHATFHLFQLFDLAVEVHKQEDVLRQETLVIGGGGNLVEGKYDDVARIIQRNVRHNRVILLPHTIVGYREVLEYTYGNLTVFCRDAVSLDLALMNGANPHQTHLAHDMVFYLDRDEVVPEFVPSEGSGVLRVMRTDGESAGSVPIPPDNFDISLAYNGDLWTSPEFAKASTSAMASYVDQFERVVTDRLHVAIISAYLGKRVDLLPNSYFKNRAVYERSMRDRFSNVRFTNTSSFTVDYVQDLAIEQMGQVRQQLESERQHRDRAEQVALEQHRIRAEERVRHDVVLRERDAERDALRLRVEQLRLRAEQLRQRAEEAAATCQQAEAEVQRLSGDVERLVDSTSWKLTKPLRRISEYTRRQRTAGRT